MSVMDFLAFLCWVNNFSGFFVATGIYICDLTVWSVGHKEKYVGSIL